MPLVQEVQRIEWRTLIPQLMAANMSGVNGTQTLREDGNGIHHIVKDSCAKGSRRHSTADEIKRNSPANAAQDVASAPVV